MNYHTSKKYYRIEYKGILTKLIVIGTVKEGFQKDLPIVELYSLNYVKNDKLFFYDKPRIIGKSYYNPNKYLDDERYFTDFKLAKNKSIEIFEKDVNPNGRYRVARFFDNVFDGYVIGELSKQKAKEECSKFKNGCLVSYKIIAV